MYAIRSYYEIVEKGEIKEVLKKHGISPGNIAKHIKGETSLGQILSSEIDVDRMDYLSYNFV